MWPRFLGPLDPGGWKGSGPQAAVGPRWGRHLCPGPVLLRVSRTARGGRGLCTVPTGPTARPGHRSGRLPGSGSVCRVSAASARSQLGGLSPARQRSEAPRRAQCACLGQCDAPWTRLSREYSPGDLSPDSGFAHTPHRAPRRQSGLTGDQHFTLTRALALPPPSPRCGRVRWCVG